MIKYLAAKLILFAYVVISPFFDHTFLTFLDNIVFRLCSIIAVIVVCFLDLQLGILALIAFLVFIVNVHRAKLLNKPKESFGVLKLSPQDVIPTEEPIVALPTCCGSENKSAINQDMLDLFIDPKLKPYDDFVKQITNLDSLDAIQNNCAA